MARTFSTPKDKKKTTPRTNKLKEHNARAKAITSGGRHAFTAQEQKRHDIRQAAAEREAKNQKFYFDGQEVSRDEMETRRAIRAGATPDIGLGGTGTQQPLLQAERERLLAIQAAQQDEAVKFNESLPSSLPAEAVPTTNLSDIQGTFEAANAPETIGERTALQYGMDPTLFNQEGQVIADLKQTSAWVLSTFSLRGIPGMRAITDKLFSRSAPVIDEFEKVDENVQSLIDSAKTEGQLRLVERKVDQLQEYNNEIQAASKGQDPNDVDYWIDKGFTLNEQALGFQESINDYREQIAKKRTALLNVV